MPRDLTNDVKTALAANVIRPARFVELETASGFTRLWDGQQDVSWDSKTWIGVGRFGSIASIPETREVRAEGIQMVLSGIPTAMIALATGDAVPGLPAKVWDGYLDEDWQIIDDPFEAYFGEVDGVFSDDGGQTSTIRINVESELIRLQRPRERRYTDADQQREFAGDKGFEFIEKIQGVNGIPQFHLTPVQPDEPLGYE